MNLYYYCSLLLITVCRTTNTLFRMYETSRITTGESGECSFDCLYHLHLDKRTASVFEFSKAGNIELLRFCRRPTINNHESVSSFNTASIHGEEYSFDYLRKNGITARALFDWYAPMNTIEAYIMGETNGTFFNCSRETNNIWFGPRCQYSFDTNISLYEIIQERAFLKFHTSDKVLMFTNGTCYPMNDGECKSILCLDWREICDGKTDCINGLDEYRCNELEMNECDNLTEFRCRNGHCIDKAFYYDGEDDCMDLSDEISNGLNRLMCTVDVHPNCEDRPCLATWFSCGNGYCYDGPNVDQIQQCETQRDQLYFQRMPSSTFILFSHIYLIYNKTRPEWICYNDTLCPQLSLNNDYEQSFWQNENNLICRKFHRFINRTYKNFYDMIKEFKNFVRVCSISSLFQSSMKCSMFICENNNKCISYHRLSDGYHDCPNGEDEYQNNTCLLNLPYRYACDNGTRCIPQRLVGDNIIHCTDHHDEYQARFMTCENQNVDLCAVYRGEPSRNNISFELICNGILDYYPDTENNTDESDCSMDEWRCVNEVTQCEGVWNCADGHDELDCHGIHYEADPCTRNKTHFCLNIRTGLPYCLPQSKAGDGHIDCIGSTDERNFCRMKYPYDNTRRYRCQNSDQCIAPFQVCDCHLDCPMYDDETIACRWLNNGSAPFCDTGYFRCRDGTMEQCSGIGCRCDMKIRHCKDGEDELFCDLIDRSYIAPLHINQLEEHPHRTHSKIVRRSTNDRGFIAWYCNSGLYIRSTDSPSGFYCLCPDYYYGDRCQYQRKRITLILQPLITGSFSRLSIFKIIVLLVRQNTTIVSHDQFFYVPQVQCLTKYFVQLLYPINESWSSTIKYSVHVHSFTSRTFKHRGSWQWDVPFNFLPVFRMVKRILMFNTGIPIQSSLTTAYHRHCNSCSNSSLCIGYDTNLGRDICICHLNRTGHRCLIPFNPCSETSCNKHGICLPIDERFDQEMQYRCVCNLGWFGHYCEKSSASIHFSFPENISVSSFKTALIHVILPQFGPPHLTYFHRLQNHISSYVVYLDEFDFIQGLVFIQIFENLDEFDIYLLAKHDNYKINSHLWKNISVQIDPSYRCRSINELFNKTVLDQPPLRRIKYFQQVCLNRVSKSKFYCFYDEKLMCFCDKTNYANCFNFDATSYDCSWNKCSNRGKCVQNHGKCPTNSLCLCEPCSYGSICQFTTNGYAMSLDAILGSHIVENPPTSIFRHTDVIRNSVVILAFTITIGILLNLIAIGTFIQKRTRQIASGWYLLVSSILGLFTMITLIFKITFLIYIPQGNLSCSLIEFLLKWWPTSSDWFHACVAIERALAVIQQAQYSNRRSLRRVKWIVPALSLGFVLIYSPELIYRRIIIDPQDQRIWCAFNIDNSRKQWQRLYNISDLIMFIIPLVINFITSIIIIMGTLHFKERAIQRVNVKRNQIHPQPIPNVNYSVRSTFRLLQLRNRLGPIKKQIIKYKHILIAPVLLGIFSTSRVVMAFTFVCTKLDQQPYFTLFAYLVGFYPSMAILFAFILPSKEYRATCLNLIKLLVPQPIQNLFSVCILRHRHI